MGKEKSPLNFSTLILNCSKKYKNVKFLKENLLYWASSNKMV